jgi:hypothetical protein
VRGLLAPGGWLYITVPAAEDGAGEAAPEGFDDVANLFVPSDLEAPMRNNNFTESQSPDRIDEHGEMRLHGLYRRVKAPAPR